jgi:hypothetical protein
MAIKLGSTDINSVNLGSVGLNRIYSGSDFVFGGVAPFEFGNALQFDGINDYVSFSPILKEAPTPGFCFGFWIRFTSTPSFEHIIGDSTSINQWFRWNNSTSATFRSRNVGAATTTFSFPAISTSTWYYVAVSLIGSTNYLWINGIRYTGDSDNYDNENINIDRIGTDGINYGEFIIDELFVKAGSALTNQNVLDLYNSGNGQYATDVIDSLGVYYRFNESGLATVATDSSGNGNDGTLNNFTSPPDYWVTH